MPGDGPLTCLLLSPGAEVNFHLLEGLQGEGVALVRLAEEKESRRSPVILHRPFSISSGGAGSESRIQGQPDHPFMEPSPREHEIEFSEGPLVLFRGLRVTEVTHLTDRPSRQAPLNFRSPFTRILKLLSPSPRPA